MASILATDYNNIATKIESLRATVGGAWSSISLSAKPTVTATSSKITAQQINNLIKAYNHFSTLWNDYDTCNVTSSGCSNAHKASADCGATSGADWSGYNSSYNSTNINQAGIPTCTPNKATYGTVYW